MFRSNSKLKRRILRKLKHKEIHIQTGDFIVNLDEKRRDLRFLGVYKVEFASKMLGFSYDDHTFLIKDDAGGNKIIWTKDHGKTFILLNVC